jgi:hypothetical protein
MKLVTLIGDRRFGTVKITGDATVGYGMQVITRYADSVGLSDLTAIGGGAESKIEQRLTSTADQTIRSGVLRLVEEPNAQSSSAAQIASIDGINLSYHAPPAQAPNPLPTSAAQVMNHPNITPSLSIAGITATNTPATPTVSASVANELPSASGGFNFTTTAVSGFANSGYFWVDNQVPADPRSTLLAIDPTKQVLRTTATTPSMSGSTSSNATALTPTSTRGVFSSAQISLNNVRIMPTTFIGPQPKTVFVVDSFGASTTCNSTVSSGVAAVDRGTWDATVEVFVDNNNNGVQGGSYQTLTFHGDSTAGNVTVSGTLNGTTYTNAPFSQLAANLVSSDPLVLDGITAGTDAYLIQDASHPNGYLTAWTATNPVASVDTAKTTTTASITGAMNVATVATNSSIPESGLNILFGKLSCTSFDNRG